MMNFFSPFKLLFFSVALSLSCLVSSAIIINAGEGFDDPTVVSPVGGNQGLTLGEQRLAVFQRAAMIWSSYLEIDVDVVVNAAFSELSCTTNSGVLGAAGPLWVDRDFIGAVQARTWYAGALSLQLKGFREASFPTEDIEATFNSRLEGNSNCLGAYSWYYGFDDNAAANEVDLLPIVLHELAHGLGFLSLIEEDSFNNVTGKFFADASFPEGLPDAFSANLRDVQTGKLWTAMSDAERKISAKNDSNLVWQGLQANVFTSLLSIGAKQGFVRMYAPTTWDSGSSVSHFDSVLTYNSPYNPEELMEPDDTGLSTSDFVTVGSMADMGWVVKRDFDGDGITDPLDNFPLVADLAFDTDLDGTPNVSDLDDDDDGMPDVFEKDNFLNPLDPSDAALDADNDGATNLQEFLAGSNPLLIDQPPQFLGLQPVMTIPAAGVFTDYSFPGLSVKDSRGNNLSYNISPLPPWRSGEQNLTFTAIDNLGNQATENVTLRIKPIVQVLGPAEAAEGDAFDFKISLSGDSPTALPLNLNYVISGTASAGLDHDLQTGQIQLPVSGEAVLPVNVLIDAITESPEVLTITFQSSNDVSGGEYSSKQVTINESGDALQQVDLALSVLGSPVSHVSQGAQLSVDVLLTDTASSTYSYDWSASDDALGIDGLNSSSVLINTAGFADGLYKISVAVTDNANSANVARSSISVVIGSTLRTDSDQDGVADANDGLANALTLQTANTNANSFLLETTPGLLLRLGDQPLLYNAGGSFMNSDFYPSDPGKLYTEGVYDLELRRLDQGGTGRFFIPLTANIKVNDQLRVLVADRWQEIFLDANNSVMSANNLAAGFCPEFESPSYSLGANSGDNCLLIQVQDGGANDADGEVNGLVKLVVGVASNAPSTGGGGGGGSPSFAILAALLVLIWQRNLLCRETLTKSH